MRENTGKMRRPDWVRLYSFQVGASDAVVVTVAIFFSQFIWIGNRLFDSLVVIPESSELSDTNLPYAIVSSLIAATWFGWLGAARTRSIRVVGIGTSEYSRVVNVGVAVFSAWVTVFFFFKIDIARGYLITAVGLGVIALLATRWLWRQWLMKQRREGLMSSRAIVVGSHDGVGYIADQFHTRFPHAGYRIIGACYTDGAPTLPEQHAGVPMAISFRAINDVQTAVIQNDIDVVIVAGGGGLSPSDIRELSWALEGLDVEMAVSPALLDVVGPRIHARSIAGLPLMHVDIPEYDSGRSFLKSAFDRSVAALALLTLAPAFLAIAVIIKVTSPGPIFFRQERVGLRGETFEMLKFRSMHLNAESMLEDLKDKNEANGGVLFKLRADPRVTPVGRVLRKHSLDELPQFINVLKGDMSVVGPRPPLKHEVDQYEKHVQRRFLVRPGLTGPWQISGRSDLTWDESVRLDLYYVENWSLTTDLVYIWRTLKVMLDGRGAY